MCMLLDGAAPGGIVVRSISVLSGATTCASVGVCVCSVVSVLACVLSCTPVSSVFTASTGSTFSLESTAVVAAAVSALMVFIFFFFFLLSSKADTMEGSGANPILRTPLRIPVAEQLTVMLVFGSSFSRMGLEFGRMQPCWTRRCTEEQVVFFLVDMVTLRKTFSHALTFFFGDLERDLTAANPEPAAAAVAVAAAAGAAAAGAAAGGVVSVSGVVSIIAPIYLLCEFLEHC